MQGNVFYHLQSECSGLLELLDVFLQIVSFAPKEDTIKLYLLSSNLPRDYKLFVEMS